MPSTDLRSNLFSADRPSLSLIVDVIIDTSLAGIVVRPHGGQHRESPMLRRSPLSVAQHFLIEFNRIPTRIAHTESHVAIGVYLNRKDDAAMSFCAVKRQCCDEFLRREKTMMRWVSAPWKDNAAIDEFLRREKTMLRLMSFYAVKRQCCDEFLRREFKSKIGRASRSEWVLSMCDDVLCWQLLLTGW